MLMFGGGRSFLSFFPCLVRNALLGSAQQATAPINLTLITHSFSATPSTRSARWGAAAPAATPGASFAPCAFSQVCAPRQRALRGVDLLLAGLPLQWLFVASAPAKLYRLTSNSCFTLYLKAASCALYSSFNDPSGSSGPKWVFSSTFPGVSSGFFASITLPSLRFAWLYALEDLCFSTSAPQTSSSRLLATSQLPFSSTLSTIFLASPCAQIHPCVFAEHYQVPPTLLDRCLEWMTVCFTRFLECLAWRYWCSLLSVQFELPWQVPSSKSRTQFCFLFPWCSSRNLTF